MAEIYIKNRKKPSLAIFVKTLLMGCLILAFFIGYQPETAATGEVLDAFNEGEIVVGLIPGARINDFNNRYGTTIREQIAGTNHFLLRLAPGDKVESKLIQLTGDPDVEFSAPNFNLQHAEVRQRSQAFIDQRSQAFIDGQSPIKFYDQPSAPQINLSAAQQISHGWGVRVAVIDTGIDFDHPVFANRIGGPYYDFVDNDDYPREAFGGPGSGHGTFVSGLILLTAPGAVIMPIRAFDKSGSGTSFNIAKAIRFAVDNGAQIINMSFGLLNRDPLIDSALEYAYQKVYMISSAGNDNLNMLHFPAQRNSKTISVASVDTNDLKADFSNYDKDVMVSAPGVGLYSAYPGKKWAVWSGTSFSTALVSGEAALLLYLNPDLNRTAINKIIMSSGINIYSKNPLFFGLLGSVRIDLFQAVMHPLTQR